MTSLFTNPQLLIATAVGVGGAYYYFKYYYDIKPSRQEYNDAGTTAPPNAIIVNNTYDARKQDLGCDLKKTWTFKFWETSTFCKARARLQSLL